MAYDIPGGKKGAGILRWKPNFKWNNDRGMDVPSAPGGASATNTAATRATASTTII